MSSALPDTAPPAVPSPAPGRRPRRLFSRIVLVVTLLMGLWLGYVETPREIARWYLAAAIEHRIQGNYERLHNRPYDAAREQTLAEIALKRASAWNPKDGSIYLEKAAWHLEDGNYSAALADCDRAAQLGAPSRRLSETRGVALVHLKRYDEAVKEAERYHKLLSDLGYKYAARLHLNQVAYHRSLGKVDLPQALKEINESLAGVPRAHQDADRLDTRGFVLHQMGRYREAIIDFDLAVLHTDNDLAYIRSSLRERLLKTTNHREVELNDRKALSQLAVIYYHRSLVLEKLNRWKEAQQDRRKARDLLGGREPDESLF